ncbi:hypothetical protein SEVIR_5G135666v4 [Setaria viridis]
MQIETQIKLVSANAAWLAPQGAKFLVPLTFEGPTRRLPPHVTLERSAADDDLLQRGDLASTRRAAPRRGVLLSAASSRAAAADRACTSPARSRSGLTPGPLPPPAALPRAWCLPPRGRRHRAPAEGPHHRHRRRPQHTPSHWQPPPRLRPFQPAPLPLHAAPALLRRDPPARRRRAGAPRRLPAPPRTASCSCTSWNRSSVESIIK